MIWKPVAFLIASVVAFVFGLGYCSLKSQIPEKGTVLKTSALSAPAEIYWDEFGVPHIYAGSKKDAYFALGYVQAGERYFQMQLLKRLAEGRISEAVGEKGLKTDKLFRTLGFYRNSKKWLERNTAKIPAEALEIIDRFSEGIEFFRINGKIPFEMKLLGMEPEKIEREHMLAFVAFMGFTFAEAISVDPVISSLENEFGKSAVAELTGSVSPVSAKFPSEKSRMLAEGISEFMNGFRDDISDLGIPLFQGSNSWVISPKRSKSGKAMLSNDPHIAFSNPSIWFEAYMKVKDQEMYGMHLPLVPFPIIGFNSALAWGLTMFENDDMDFYHEKISRTDSAKYLYRGKEIPFETVTEEIQVRGSSPVRLEIKSTLHGPLINGIAKSLEEVSTPVSVRWPMFDDSNNPVKALYQMNESNSMNQFISAGESLKVPGLNFVYADKTGNIAYFACGGLYRKAVRGDRILDGSSGTMEWGEILPYSFQPKNINPENGLIFTANHIHFKNSQVPIDGYWQADDRSERLTELLYKSTKDKFSIEDMKDYVLDDKFYSAPLYLSYLLPVLEKNEDTLHFIEKQGYEILKKWDGKGNSDEPGAAVFSEFRLQLGRAIFLDEMGEKRFKSVGGTAQIHHFIKAVLKNRNSVFWDDISTPGKKETPEEIVFTAYRRAVAVLMGRMGTDTKLWRWGRLHKLELKHPLGEIPFLRPIFNSGPREISGGTEVVNNLMSKFASENHDVAAGPSVRMLIDFGDIQRIYIINPLGNSGHRLSPDFQNQADWYKLGKFRVKDLTSMKPEGKPTRLEP